MHDIENHETGQANTRSEEAEKEASANPIRHGCHRHTKDEGTEVGRDVEKLCRDSAVTVSLDNGRRKICCRGMYISTKRAI